MYRFIRLQANRWLYAICGILSTCWPVEANGRLASSLLKQHLASSTLAILFDVLSITINSGTIYRRSRLAKAEYYRKGEGPDDRSEEDSEEEAAGETGAAEGNYRRGLALDKSLQATNLVWLPSDLLVWDQLRVEPDLLLQMAYANSYLHRQLKASPLTRLEQVFRSEVQRQLERLREVCLEEEEYSEKYNREVRATFLYLWSLCWFRYCY